MYHANAWFRVQQVRACTEGKGEKRAGNKKRDCVMGKGGSSGLSIPHSSVRIRRFPFLQTRNTISATTTSPVPPRGRAALFGLATVGHGLCLLVAAREYWGF